MMMMMTISIIDTTEVMTSDVSDIYYWSKQENVILVLLTLMAGIDDCYWHYW